jgi:AcrR family transcriptional regulator
MASQQDPPLVRPQRQQRRRRPARSEDERQAKRDAILDAALDVFADKGFAQARLDDVAARAGVAKGTVYLYVASKEALFEELVRSGIAAPIAEIAERALAHDAPLETTLRMLFTFLRKEVVGTRRAEIARLVLAEAGRFPDLAALYHREVVSRGMALIRGILERAATRGEIAADEVVRFPQLVIAPGLVAILWSALFARLEPLDVEGMLDTHLALLMRALKSDRR